MNSEKALPDLYLDLDRRRRVKLGLKGLNAVERKMGRSFFKAINWKDIGTQDMTLILWAGMIADDPDLTFEQVEELFDLVGIFANFENLRLFVEAVVDRAMPMLSEEEQKAVEEQKKRVLAVMEPTSTGSRCGPSDGSPTGSPSETSGT